MFTENHSQYRRLFYFFQFAFVSRGFRCKQNPVDDEFNVVRDLALNADYYHFRNEYMPLQPLQVGRRKQPEEDTSPEAPQPIGKVLSLKESKEFKKHQGFTPRQARPVLYTATSESRYRHLMLYSGEVLKTRNGRTWRDFPNLYRALLIYDLYQSGLTAEDIYHQYGNLYLEEIPQRIRDNQLQHIYTLEAEQEVLNFAESNSLPFVTACETENCDEPLYIHRFIDRIESHNIRATQLIKLAEAGQFKIFPSAISPIK